MDIITKEKQLHEVKVKIKKLQKERKALYRSIYEAKTRAKKRQEKLLIKEKK